MKKYFLKKIVLVIAIAGAYLYLTNYYIYYRIGAAGLKSSDNQYTYMIGDNASLKKSLKYAALGDSFTSGVGANDYKDSYPYLVAQNLGGGSGIVLEDFSIPGVRTSGLIDNLLDSAIAAKPDIVTILIGTNDIHGRVSQAEFEKNYRYIIENLKEKTSAKIYLISIPFAGSDRLFFPPYNYYFKQETIKFNEVIIRLAKTYNVGYIDIASPTKETFEKSGMYYAADSFHPSAAGYKLWAQIIYDNINQQSS